MGWIILAIAVFTEICWALSLKWAATLGTWQASAVPVTLSFVNMALLALAMREISAGTAYAIWTGIGAVGAFAVGALVLGEPLTPLRIAGVGLVASGLIVLKLASSH